MRLKNRFTEEVKVVVGEELRNYDKRIWEVIDEKRVGHTKEDAGIKVLKLTQPFVDVGGLNLGDAPNLIIEGEDLKDYDIHLWSIGPHGLVALCMN